MIICIENAPTIVAVCDPAESWRMKDGFCDDITNTKECNYDGGDCCDPNAYHNEAYCTACECLEGKDGNNVEIANSLPSDVLLPKPIVLWKIKIKFVKHDQQISPYVELRGCLIRGIYNLI